ncbi:MAG: tetratricopeptide repeat protein [Calditrichaeota bacterium]|nr:tetratricopeptide repeat protein [Calditrichota bacterium]
MRKQLGKVICWMVLVWMMTLPVDVHADVDRSKVKKGKEAFEAGQWDEALNYFQDALLDAPQDPRLHFNVGDALYKKQRYEEALQAFEKALNTRDPRLQQQVYYNMGNTYYFLNRYEEAINAYKKALELDPSDQDAKHNLELVRAKLKEMAQKQQQQMGNSSRQQQSGQQQQNQGNQQQEGEQQQEQQPGQQEQSQQEFAQQQSPRQEGESQQNEEQQQQPAQAENPNEQPLSREEAERILQALQGKKDNKDMKPFRVRGGKRKVEKDW